MEILTETISNVFRNERTKRVIKINPDSIGDETHDYLEYLNVTRPIIQRKYLETSDNLPSKMGI